MKGLVDKSMGIVTLIRSLLKKDRGTRAPQLGPVVDSGASRHAGNHYHDVLTILPTSFLMYPDIGPPVKSPVVLLGVHPMRHAAARLKEKGPRVILFQ